MEFVLLQAVFLPLLLSPVAYLIGRNYGATAATWFTFGLLLYCTVILINAALGGTYEEHYPWTTMFGEFGFLLDGLATPFAIIIYVLCTVLALYSKPYMVHKFEELFKEHYHQNTTTDGQTTAVVDSTALKKYVNHQSGLYFAMFLVFAMGMLGTVLATNLIEFYIFFEVMLIPSFFLVAFYGDGNRRRIALQFLFWTHVGAVVLLLGFLAIGLSVGSFDFVDISEAAIDPDILV
ncbi:MAG: proton-conducting transporter membrane subunit, partial [Thermoproteota archaeon]|nr:proton-conducting transporter membrane subunit [Thermoproteota archaeon]